MQTASHFWRFQGGRPLRSHLQHALQPMTILTHSGTLFFLVMAQVSQQKKRTHLGYSGHSCQ